MRLAVKAEHESLDSPDDPLDATQCALTGAVNQ